MNSPISKISRSTLTRQNQDDDKRVTLIMGANTALSTVEDFVTEITAQWDEARDRFLRIGQCLIQAKQKLPHGEFEDMIERRLPFGKAVAHQLRSVADAVQRGKLVASDLPSSYSIAYQLVTLDDDELSIARNNGLIRPDVKRAEIIKFKTSHRTAKLLPAPTDGPSLQAQAEEQIDRQLAELRGRRDDLRAQLEEVEQQIEALEKEGNIVNGTAERVA
jgi:hypothetical protein